MPSPLTSITSQPGTSPQTRQVLESRLALTEPSPQFFTAQEFATLATLADLILPQTNVHLAALIDARLAAGETMGWRFAALPPDAASFRTALHLVAEHLEADPARRQSFLEEIQDKQHDTAAFPISLWLQNLKAELTRNWLAHPQTMAQLNYHGFADDLLVAQDRA